MRRDRTSPLLLVMAAILGVGATCGPAEAPSNLSNLSALPPPAREGKMPLEEALARRRSIRQYKPQALSRQQIGQLCWSAQGITEMQKGLRTAPSAGALYPLELYVVTAGGVEHYVPARHAMDKHLEGDWRGKLAEAAVGQKLIAEAPATFIFMAVVSRSAKKYGDRALRYCLQEQGHACQNLLLQATALGLGAVPIGACEDDRIAKLLSLGGDGGPIYLVAVGTPDVAAGRP